MQVFISVQKSVFALDEPIPVKWRIKNVCKEDKTIIWHDLHYSPVVFEIGKETERKDIREDSRRMFFGRIPAPLRKIVLWPGDEQEGTFDLRYFGLSHEKEGLYEVTGLYSPKDSRVLADRYLKKPEFNDVATDRVDSGTIEITLTKDLSWLNNRLSTGEFWDRLRAAKRLAPLIGNEKVLADLEKMYPPDNTRHMVWLVNVMAELNKFARK